MSITLAEVAQFQHLLKIGLQLNGIFVSSYILYLILMEASCKYMHISSRFCILSSIFTDRVSDFFLKILCFNVVYSSTHTSHSISPNARQDSIWKCKKRGWKLDMTYLEIFVYDNEVFSFFHKKGKNSINLLKKNKETWISISWNAYPYFFEVSYFLNLILFLLFFEAAIISLLYDKELSLQSHEFLLVYDIWIVSVFPILFLYFSAKMEIS